MRSPALFLSAVTLASFLTGTALGDVSSDVKKAPTGSYALETRHSQIVFAIMHLGLTDFYGRFEKLGGTLNFNASDPAKSSVEITIDTASVNVPNAAVIRDLVAADAFNVAKFPTATFKSTSVTRTGPNTGKITGDLTLCGVTKPVTLDVTFNGGTADPMMGNNYDIGFHASTLIKRSDFGLDQMTWRSFVADDVKLTIEAMFVHQKN
jgi:polyisoprenoid-binding protein YceI